MYNSQISFSQILLGFISSITSGSITCPVIMISTFVLDFRTILYMCVCMYICMCVRIQCLLPILSSDILVGWSLSFSSFLQKCSCKQYSLSSVYLLYLKNGMTGYEISGSYFILQTLLYWFLVLNVVAKSETNLVSTSYKGFCAGDEEDVWLPKGFFVYLYDHSD